MWQEISTEAELQQFMSSVYCFHDSCIKELKYISGAYVDNDLFMYPLNDRRLLRVVIQRQFEDKPMLELEFEGIRFLILSPVNEHYTCEISGSTMFFKDGYIYWYDEEWRSKTNLERIDLNSFMGTVVCASKLRWRPIENKLGPAEYYHQDRRTVMK